MRSSRSRQARRLASWRAKPGPTMAARPPVRCRLHRRVPGLPVGWSHSKMLRCLRQGSQAESCPIAAGVSSCRPRPGRQHRTKGLAAMRGHLELPCHTTAHGGTAPTLLVLSAPACQALTECVAPPHQPPHARPGCTPAPMATALTACGACPSQLVHVQPGVGDPGQRQALRSERPPPGATGCPAVQPACGTAAGACSAPATGAGERPGWPDCSPACSTPCRPSTPGAVAPESAGGSARSTATSFPSAPRGKWCHAARPQTPVAGPPPPPPRAGPLTDGAPGAPRPRPALRPSETALRRPPATPRAACSCSCWRVKRWLTALPGAPSMHGRPLAHGRRARAAPSHARLVRRAAWTPSQRRAGSTHSVALADTPPLQPCGAPSAPDRAHRLEVIAQGSAPAKCVRLDLACSFRLCGTPGTPTPPALCSAAAVFRSLCRL